MAKTLTDFCGEFGMVPAPGLDGNMLVDEFTGNFLEDQGVQKDDPEAVKAFLNDPSIPDEVKEDGMVRALLGGESDDDAIKHALRDYALA